MMFSSLMKFCSVLVSIYALFIILRIMMTWFQGFNNRYSRITYFFERVTEPYLAFFRGFRIFRLGLLDFSPVLALIVLSVAGNIFLSLAVFRQITLGLVLALLLSNIWSAAAFFLGLYVFLIALRIIGLLTRINVASPFWRYIDTVLNPVLFPILRAILRGANIPYLTGLLIGGGVLLAIRIFGAMAVTALVLQLQKIPF
jgi:YggT family protein